MKPLRLLGYAGRTLLTVGVLLLLFVAYQLWGTGLHEAQAQDNLSEKFEKMVTAVTPPPTTAEPEPDAPPATLPPKVAASKDIAPKIGEPVGRLQIPKIDVDKIVVQGISLTQLNRAPGHFPQTPFPGQAGNSSIAGHRTTYGAPFGNINHLVPGDKIIITTVQGRFVYAVQWAKIVLPDAMWVIDTAKDHPNTLTLAACHPRFDLSHRYIIRAVLQGQPVPEMKGQSAAMHKFAENADDTIAGGITAPANPDAWIPTLLWAIVCAGIWLGTWWLSRRWRRGEHRQPPRWTRALLPYVAGVPLFLGALFFSYMNLSKLLPAGL